MKRIKLTKDKHNGYILGDSLKILPTIPNNYFNLSLTSIPDLSEINIIDIDKYIIFLYKIFEQLSRIIKDDGFLVFCQTDKKHKGTVLLKHKIIIDYFISENWVLKDYKINIRKDYKKIDMYRFKFQHILIFTKFGKIKRKGEWLQDILDFGQAELSSGNNMSFSPDFVKYFVNNLTIKNQNVLDCFAGRGTVYKICKNMGRESLGIELLSSNYVEKGIIY